MSQQLTPNFALPYYQGSDPADGATQQQALAVKLDTVLKPFAPVTVTSLVGEVGQTTQARAGRQLALSDFTNLGLSAPRGLWNLSDLTDASGNGRTLTNKNTVTFSPGVNGAATTAAQFTGSTSQALYIADTGAADPFRISTGSWGCWFRTAKRGTSQGLLTKRLSATQIAYQVAVGNTNTAAVGFSGDGTSFAGLLGVSDVCDDRWHFAVATQDGTYLRIYVDGVLEAATMPGGGGSIFGSSAPLNIGAYGADSGAAATDPHYGRVDEAFVTADVLTEDQVRFLYAARLVHTLGAQPKTVSLSVRRQRRGAALATTDFSTTPLHLYNYAGGSPATDQGSLGLPMSGGAVYLGPGTDGTPNGSRGFIGGLGDNATDAGLPTGLQSRSYGCWIKTANASGVPGVIGWGASNSSTAGAVVGTTSGAIYSQSGAGDTITGPFVADGQWHHVVAVEDNTAGDGVKRKLYLDGRVIANSTVMNSITPGGAGRFRVGAYPDATGGFTGQIDGVFVTGYAMTTDEVLRLYAKASQTMASSPKNSGDHVEAVDSGSVLVIADTLDAVHYIDLTLA
jgi:hypothetical protein